MFKKTSKNGVTTYFHNVLEAKLLTPSGLSLSIATEWISNEGKDQFEKQDCERMAFLRLAQKIKKFYPRLPIAIVSDGLYPWDGFFETCQRYNWKYIVVLKDGSLKSLQEEIQLEKLITPRQTTRVMQAEKDIETTLDYQWLRVLSYKKHKVSFVECNERVKIISTKQEFVQRFVHLTNFEVNGGMCYRVSFTGRLRQKMEIEINKTHLKILPDNLDMPKPDKNFSIVIPCLVLACPSWVFVEVLAELLARKRNKPGRNKPVSIKTFPD